MMSHLKYDKLSDALQRQIITDRENRTQPDFGARDEDVIRRNMERDRQNLWRPFLYPRYWKNNALPIL